MIHSCVTPLVVMMHGCSPGEFMHHADPMGLRHSRRVVMMLECIMSTMGMMHECIMPSICGEGNKLSILLILSVGVNTTCFLRLLFVKARCSVCYFASKIFVAEYSHVTYHWKEKTTRKLVILLYLQSILSLLLPRCRLAAWRTSTSRSSRCVAVS